MCLSFLTFVLYPVCVSLTISYMHLFYFTLGMAWAFDKLLRLFIAAVADMRWYLKLKLPFKVFGVRGSDNVM